MAGHVLGIVKSAQGVVDVRSADGKIRSLLVGDSLREGDTVLTTGGGKLVIALSEGGELVLGPGEAVVMTAELSADRHPTADESQVASVDSILAALQEGKDLNSLLEATAAGPAGGPGTNEGHTFVQLLRVVENVGEVNGLTTAGIERNLPDDIQNITIPEPNNVGPDAVDDSVTTPEGTPVTITVLQNDTDPEKDPLTVTNVTVPPGTPGTVTLNPNGTITYDPGDAFNHLGTGQEAQVTFTYTITDGNGGTDTATVTVTITGVNDPPTVTVDTQNADNVSNEAGLPNGSQGPDQAATAAGGTFQVADPDGIEDILTVTINFTNPQGQPESVEIPIGVLGTNDPANTINTNAGQMVITGYDPATGTATYEYHLTTATTDVPGVTETDVFTVTTSDGEATSAPATITIEIVDDVPVAVNDTDSVAAASNAPATGNLITDAENDGGQDTTGADGASVTAVTGSGSNSSANGVFTVNGTYGVLTVNADGSYSYARNPGSPGGVTDTFNYTITDGDGDASSANLVISIGDGSPTISIPAAGGPTTTVAEAGLPARNGESAGSNEAATSETVSGTITFNSPDGVSAVQLGGMTLTGTDQTTTDATGSLTASYSYDAASGVGTITYTYTLGDNTSGDGTNVSFPVLVTDGDGDATTPGNLVINVTDDVPTARLDTDSVAADQFTAETGNVITGVGTTNSADGADTQGADGVTVTGATGAGQTTSQNGTFTVAGQYGVLTLGADGGYSYVRNAGTPGGVDDTFNYTITDGDGDTSSANLVISIGDNAPTLDIPAAGGPTTTVSESGLPARPGESAGSNEAADSETVSGTISFTSLDGVQSVQLGGMTLTGSPQTNGAGSLTASYTYDAASGVGTISYTYTLLDNTSGDDTNASFAVQVTDADGDVTSPGNLVINIVDDVPTARLDTDSVAANQFTAETGNVITGEGTTNSVAGADTRGADGASVTGATGFGSSSTVNGVTTVNGQYGVLTIGADGGYSYVRNAGTPGGVTDTFNYTLTDGDGDGSNANLVISIGDSAPTVTIPAAGGPTTTVSESGLPARTGEPAGSNEAANSETVSGTITFNSPDGVSAVQLGSLTLTGANQTTTDATGSLTASYVYDAATGVGTISYSYTLTDNTSGDDTNATFAVTVTDADGDPTSPGNLVINIVDDVPTARLDTDSIAANATTAEGNVITGGGTTNSAVSADTLGADGATVSAVTGGANQGTFANGVFTVAGQYGTLTLDPQGGYSYVRNAGTPGGVEDTFTYTLTDGDGDTSSANLVISIGDNVPTIDIPAAGGATTTVSESGLPARTGESAGSDAAANTETVSGTISFTSLDGVTSVQLGGMTLTGAPQTTANATGSLTASYTFDPATGQGSISYTYTLLDNTSGDTTTASFPVTVTDGDGDPTNPGNLVINIVDDVPTARLDTDSVAATQFTAETGNVITGAGTTSGASGADTRGADSANVSGATGFGSSSTANGVTTVNGQYGVLTIGADGGYSYVRNAGTPGGVTDTFNYTLTDSDGDTSSANLVISIGDNAPTITIPAPGGASTTVSEAGLPARTGESAGSNEAANSETVSGTISFTSLDGVSSVTLGGMTLTGGNQVTANATGSLTASYTYDAATGAGTITYSYTLADNTSGDNTNVSFPVQVADADGDVTTPGNLVINIVDDVPTARLDTDSIAANATTAEGNVITGGGTTNSAVSADTLGADGASVTAVTSGANQATFQFGVFTVAGQYGVLTIDPQGGYSYVRNAGSAGGVTDTFTYTLTDGDGDTSSAQLQISIADGTPTVTIPAAGGPTTTVSESGLPARTGESAGSNAAANTETVSGTISFNSPDGVSSVTLGGATVTTTPQVVATDATGTLTASYTYDAATGVGSISYTYTLTDNTSGDNTNATFAVVIRDADNDPTSPGNLVINIVDDVPTANLDTNSVTEGASVSGNVLTNDVFGADSGTIQGVVAGTSTANPVSGNIGSSIAGTYGTLTLNANGSYTYVANPNSVPPAGAQDSFVYTIKDGDGDLSTTTLTITVGDSGLSAVSDSVQVSEAALPTGSNPSSTAESVSGTMVGNASGGLPGYTYALVGSSTGLYGTLVLAASGAYTYTLTQPYDTNPSANNGNNIEANRDVFTVRVTDANGNSVDTQINVSIVDDVPTLSPGNLAIANVAGTFSGNLGFASGADVQTVAESFSSANAVTWTNVRPGFGYTYDATTQTGTATFVDNGVTKTFFTVHVNNNGTYDFTMVNPDPVTVQSIPSLLTTITGGNGQPSFTIPASNFGGEFSLVLTGSSAAHPRNPDGTPTETINLSSSSLGVGDDVMHGSKGDVLRFDVQSVNGSDASPTSLTVTVDGTASWKATDSADLIIKYVGESAVTVTQVWGADQSVTFSLDPTKTLDYMELKPHTASESFKINGVAMSYEVSVFPDDYQLNFSATGTDADGDTAAGNFTVAVNTATGSTYQIDGTSGDDTLHGTSGNDTLIGGGGSDTFVWHLADKGTAGSPAIDKVSDFGTGGNDVLNVRDLLQGENKADVTNLDNYLHFTQSGGTTTVHISSSGGYSGGFNAGATDQQIQLTGVDLTALGNDQQIIQNLVNNGKLVTD